MDVSATYLSLSRLLLIRHHLRSKKSVAAWQATIKVDTTNGGLKVSVDYKAPHLSLHDEHPHCCHFDIAAKHREVMVSRLLDFEQRVLPQLRLAVENTWKYSTMGIQTVSLRDPVFTKKGDLICELDLSRGLYCFYLHSIAMLTDQFL